MGCGHNTMGDKSIPLDPARVRREVVVVARATVDAQVMLTGDWGQRGDDSGEQAYP